MLHSEYRAVSEEYERTQQLAREGLASYVDSAPSAQRLADLIEEIRSWSPATAQFGDTPQLDELTAALSPRLAAIYLLPGTGNRIKAPYGSGVALVLRHDGRCIRIGLPDLTMDVVRQSVAALVNGGQPSAVATWMWTVVMAPLLEHAREPDGVLYSAEEWAVVPTGLAGLLPFHAAGSADTGWIDDHVTVRVIPSLLAITNNPMEALLVEGSASLICVSGAGNLKFPPADQAIARAYLPRPRLVADPVTPDAVLEGLADSMNAIISGHAAHSLAEGGGLALDGGWLTGDDTDRLPLRMRDLAILSACSSGQTASELPDETIGLPSSLLRAGFQTVISTMWPVRDPVAFLTVARFLQLRHATPASNDAQLLRDVRTWLRNATTEGLHAWLNDVLTQVDIPPMPVTLLRDWWNSHPVIGGPARPCSDVRDWAAFTITSRTPTRTR